jgi:hypothetical protein
VQVLVQVRGLLLSHAFFFAFQPQPFRFNRLISQTKRTLGSLKADGALVEEPHPAPFPRTQNSFSTTWGKAHRGSRLIN